LDVVVERLRRRRVVVVGSKVGPFVGRIVGREDNGDRYRRQPSASLYRAKLLNCRELCGLM